MTAPGDMELRYFELPPIGTNAYLLIAPERGEAALFDAPLEVTTSIAPILEKRGCRLTGLYLTHGHWDHTLEAAEVRRGEVPVYCHVADRGLVEDPSQMADFLLPGLGVEPAQVDVELQGGEVLEILGEAVEVRFVPGHSPGSVLFYLRDQGAAISGDTIFRGGVGRTDLPGGGFEILEGSIRQRIYTLPQDTILYPGHGPSTTVEQERRSNPFVHD